MSHKKLTEALVDILESELSTHPNLFDYIKDAEKEASYYHEQVHEFYGEQPIEADELKKAGVTKIQPEAEAKEEAENEKTAEKDVWGAPLLTKEKYIVAGILKIINDSNKDTVSVNEAIKQFNSNTDGVAGQVATYLINIDDKFKEAFNKAKENPEEEIKFLGRLLKKDFEVTQSFVEENLKTLNEEDLKNLAEHPYFKTNFWEVLAKTYTVEDTLVNTIGEKVKTAFKDNFSEYHKTITGEEYDMKDYDKTNIKVLLDKLHEKLAQSLEGEIDTKAIFEKVIETPAGKKYLKTLVGKLQSYSGNVDEAFRLAESEVGGGRVNFVTGGQGSSPRNLKILEARRATIAYLAVQAFMITLSRMAEQSNLVQGAMQEEKYTDKYVQAIYEDLVTEYAEDYYPEFVISVLKGLMGKTNAWLKLKSTLKNKITDFKEVVETPSKYQRFLSELLKGQEGKMKSLVENMGKVSKEVEEGFQKLPELLTNNQINWRAARPVINQSLKLMFNDPKKIKNIYKKFLSANGIKATAGAKLGTKLRQKFENKAESSFGEKGALQQAENQTSGAKE